MDDEEKYLEALITLHKGVARQGPGDATFSEFILDQLPELPARPRIADIGCGAGAGAILLARRFGGRVRAVDFSQEFLDQMVQQAGAEGLGELIEPVACDMGSLDWDPGMVDLLWSEGAAYILGFAAALKAWRPFMAENGIAVISEMNYFSADVPQEAVEYMGKLYTGIQTEEQNLALINAAGYTALGVHRLPTAAWWDNYYGPLQGNMQKFKESSDPVMQAVLRDTEEEMQFFRQYADDYGYSFYLMRAT